MCVSAHDFEDYRNEVLDDAKSHIDDEGKWYIDNGDDFESFYDDLWTCDSVTGNGSGSYYFSSYKAKKAISEFIWGEEFEEMCGEWGLNAAELLSKGPESVDVTVRCYALGFVRDELEDYWSEKFGEEEE